MYRPDDDGVIRLRVKAEIQKALKDSSLLMVGGWDRGPTGGILGEFIFKEAPKQPPKKTAPVLESKPELAAKEPRKRSFSDDN
jgi:hypothetical protein